MNGINTLTPSNAQKLIDAAADYNKCFIPDVTNLYEDAASVLARYPGKIFLDDLLRISESAAIELLSHKGGLSLKRLKVSDELSEIFVRYQGELCLSFEIAQINHLSCSLARLILTSSAKEECLEFEGLETVSWDVAQILSEFGGRLLLNKIEILSHSSARMLAFHKGTIELNGISHLTDLEASALAMHCGELCLDGITSISESVAISLVNHRGIVTLRGTKNVSTEVAEILATWGDNISISIDGKFPDHVFEILASKNRIEPFTLRNFERKRITPQSAKFLIECVKDSFLDLSNLEELCSNAALCIAKHQGFVTLSGLKSLACSVAEALSGHRGILNMDGLEQIEDHAAEFLGQHQGELRLNGLKTISDKGAKFISKHLGRVCLDGLHSISVAFAEEFAGHQGDLSLKGVTQLSNRAAEALSNRDSRFSIIGLDFIERMSVFTPSIARLCAKLGRSNRLAAIDEEIIGILADGWDCGKNGYIHINNVRSITKNTAIAFCERAHASFGHLFLNYVDEEILNVFLQTNIFVLCIPTTPKEVDILMSIYSAIISKYEEPIKVKNALAVRELSVEEKAFIYYLEELHKRGFIEVDSVKSSELRFNKWVPIYYKKFKEKFPESANSFDAIAIDMISEILDVGVCEEIMGQDIASSLSDLRMDAIMEEEMRESRERWTT